MNNHDPKNGSICNCHSFIVPVWLYHKDNSEEKELVYALLNSQSDACFIKDEILQKLAISGPDVELKLSTALGENLVTCKKISDLFVRGVNEQLEVLLSKAFSQDDIPAKRGQFPGLESVHGLPHLQCIAENLMPYQHDVEVGILIEEANCAKAIKPREIFSGADDDPYAVRTTLGWSIIGMMHPVITDCQDNSHCSCNRIVSREIEGSLVKTLSHVVMKTQAKEVFTPAQVSKMLELDYSETSKEEQTVSFLDRKFLNVLDSNTQHRRDGHYKIPLR